MDYPVVILQRGTIPTHLEFNTGAVTWTNMPAADTELLGAARWRTLADLSGVERVRLSVFVSTAGAAGARLYVAYSTDGGSSWSALTPMVAIDTAGLKDSGWGYIPDGAQAEVILTVRGAGGNGTASPVFGNISLLVQ